MKVYVLLADGFELIEAMAPVDVFRRAGVEVVTLSIGADRNVCSSNGVNVQADSLMSGTDLSDGDALVLPGGYPGYEHLRTSRAVGETARCYLAEGKQLGAICAAPIVLQEYGIGVGRRVTSHTCVREQMTDFVHTGRPVERDGNLVTAIGAGYALAFAFALLEALCGAEAVGKVKPGMELR
ncbi:MAG: DJ-1/PfpI family protein [Bacteroidaceae bacterium]|nr:DJ-1/PfpI family protein [Bacteroidaceae bacterium]